MEQEQATPQNKEHKCTCNKQFTEIKKDVAKLKKQLLELRSEIGLLRLVLRSVK
jgi:SMC interacting uncharacterized protein involved in chromosome segregation